LFASTIRRGGRRPGHSAGDPILGQIRSKELTNTLVVVVRYFGGTKLGVSGLINAYKTAAADALDQAKIKKEIVQNTYLLTYSYDITNEVMKLISDFDLTILEQDFTAICKAKIGVRLNNESAFIAEAEKIQKLKVEKL
jgi:putative IMPACT (imprinted ancient) family translation regulator